MKFFHFLSFDSTASAVHDVLGLAVKLPVTLSLSQNLALCTAALMYILSRDRLNMDLDRACLELMIKLLELDQDHSAHQDQLTAKEVEKVKEKIRKLCETVHNKHLDLENITVGGGQHVEKRKKNKDRSFPDILVWT